MRFIPTKIHGLLDYIVAVILILLPWLFNFAGPDSATYVPVVSGIITIVYSLVTRYEWGAAKIIPMTVHLKLDLVSGFVLALSPWLLGFRSHIYLPHLVLGIIEIVVSLMTIKIPHESKLAKLMRSRAKFSR